LFFIYILKFKTRECCNLR